VVVWTFVIMRLDTLVHQDDGHEHTETDAAVR
jgi:hypothetical protein